MGPGHGLRFFSSGPGAEARPWEQLRSPVPTRAPPPPTAHGAGPGRGLGSGYLNVDCSSLKAAFRCFTSSACFFLSSCSALISSSKRLDTLMAWTWA